MIGREIEIQRKFFSKLASSGFERMTSHAGNPWLDFPRQEQKVKGPTLPSRV